MKMLVFLALVLFFSWRVTYDQTRSFPRPSAPETEAELAQFLPGTSWLGDGDASNPHVFSPNGKFESNKLKPSYVVTGRRTVTIVWAPHTKIPCHLNEDCSTMTELAGERHTFIRQ